MWIKKDLIIVAASFTIATVLSACGPGDTHPGGAVKQAPSIASSSAGVPARKTTKMAKMGIDSVEARSGVLVSVGAPRRYAGNDATYGINLGDVAVIFTLSVVNKTGDVITLDTLQLDVAFGPNGVHGETVWGEGISSPSGIVPTGKTATFTVGYAGPKADVTSMTVVVRSYTSDALAIFEGAVS